MSKESKIEHIDVKYKNKNNIIFDLHRRFSYYDDNNHTPANIPAKLYDDFNILLGLSPCPFQIDEFVHKIDDNYSITFEDCCMPEFPDIYYFISLCKNGVEIKDFTLEDVYLLKHNIKSAVKVFANFIDLLFDAVNTVKRKLQDEHKIKILLVNDLYTNSISDYLEADPITYEE